MKTIFQLREMTEDELNRAEQNAQGDWAILLADGSFTYRLGKWAAMTTFVTEDMVASAYLGDGEED